MGMVVLLLLLCHRVREVVVCEMTEKGKRNYENDVCLGIGVQCFLCLLRLRLVAVDCVLSFILNLYYTC